MQGKIIGLAILAAFLAIGVTACGIQFLAWVAAVAAGLFLFWGLMVRYKPRTVGRFVTFLLGCRKIADVKRSDKQSDDWPVWFARQEKEGWKISIEHNHKTQWSEDVGPDNALPEYPRPQLVRERWMNLNGLWSFNVLDKMQDTNEAFPGQILVPYPVEAALSGVGRPVYGGEKIWYKRTFTVPAEWESDERIVLHFGAVDWQARVYVNGQFQTEHVGGYTPFSVDITDAVDHLGENEIVVEVYDPTDSGEKSRDARQLGKQCLTPSMISYTPCSGIWQTVWLEPVAPTRIEQVVTTANIKAGVAMLDVLTNQPTAGFNTRVTIKGEPTSVTVPTGHPIIVAPQEVILWDSDNPHLYEITVELLDGDRVVDQVETYFAIRELGKKKVNGNVVFTLNDKPVFHHGPLDQGYWPDGNYSPASDEALVWDLAQIKAMGFNMTRKHIKVEPARWYYHADRLGIMVWQDMISASGFAAPPRDLWVDYLQHAAPFGVKHINIRDNDYQGWGRSDASKALYYQELEEMIIHLRVFPSIVCWIPFNEYWGQFDAAAATDFVKTLDSTRIVNNVSGFYDQGVGDVYDLHVYMQDLKPVVDPVNYRACVIGEYGGQTWAIESEKFNEKTFGYGKNETQAEFKAAFTDVMHRQMLPVIEAGLAGTVYTQITDVESEINGLITYNRNVIKIPVEEVKAINDKLYQAFDKRNAPSVSSANTAAPVTSSLAIEQGSSH
ncbi:glycoside hydrolase family 2 protein [Photobacterium sp. OFAV2-7]|uniref:glycoside hydrolase family 2 protein n=1 Tax=Photobacterium sp. OFAV2-7 TaxID=2917748 RepID=UPI001EF456AA|nr:sugar-binding domain-containing protein [Photobacterium sp. OFAV2-7]MCG7584347.1 hypothetical protein [Photobacterium sp. OFAV2-7]